MNKQEKIEVLQDWVSKNYITHDKNLKDACKVQKLYEDEEIDWFDDVLAPMGWNCCDRCGALGDSELDFFWVDGFDWDEENEGDRAIQRAIAEEKTDYCAVCWECVNKLKEKGKELMAKKIDVQGESVATPVKVKVLTK